MNITNLGLGGRDVLLIGLRETGSTGEKRDKLKGEG